MESDQQSKPIFKICLTNQKPQSPTKRKQHEAFSSSSSSSLSAAAAAPSQQKRSNDEKVNVVVVVNDLPPGYGGDNAVLNDLPPGYRFCPYDEELIVHYLMNKVNNQRLPPNKIMDVNLYKHNPSQLAENFPTLGEKEWYFFTPRDRKYRNGNRPNRAAGDGYWKATGADKIVKHNGEIVGYRKALVFYKGKPPKGDKTKWIMHEYRVKGEAPKSKKGTDDMRLDDWVLCRIYQKTKQARARQPNGDEEPENPETPSVPTSPPLPPPPPLLVNANAVAEMSYNYNSVGGSNVFMGNPQYLNYPPMPYHHGGLVPAEMPQYSDGSLNPNYTKLNSHFQQPPMSFNHAPHVPISCKFPPPHVHPPPPPLVHHPPPPPPPHVHPSENIVMHGQYSTAWDLKPRLLEEDTWAHYEGCDFASQYDLYNNNFMGAFPDDFSNNLPDDVSYNPSNDDPSSL